MVLVADQDDTVAVAGEANRLQMHLGDQRAGGVDDLQPPLAGFQPHRRRHAVGAEDGAPAFRDLVQLLDEDGAGPPQLVHHVLVVYNLFAHVNRRAVEIQRNPDHIDSPHHPGAEAPRLQEIDLLVRAVVGSDGFKGHKAEAATG